jgi:hypothetical protein
MQTISKKCPLKENGNLSKLFLPIPWSLIYQRDLIPNRTNSCGFQTLQNKILQGIKPHRTMAGLSTFYRYLFCGV